MSWNEQEHPKDDDEKFTFKNGGDNKSKQTPAEILYKNSKIKKEEEIMKQKEKSNLLDILGNKATPTDILYGDEKSLSKKIKKYGLDGKITGGASRVSVLGEKADETGADFIGKQIGENYDKARHNITKIISGKDTAGMLDLAHGDKMNEKSYIKDAIKLKNFDDPAVTSDKEYLKAKVSKQFKDYGFKTDDIKGYFFKKDSEPSKRVSENKDFHQILKDNKDTILNGKDFSGRFPAHFPKGVFANSNLKNAIGAADFKHPYLDKEGNLHVKMYDTYDFNKNATDALNKAGRREMEKGNLKPYFSIHDIIISKDKLDEIWK